MQRDGINITRMRILECVMPSDDANIIPYNLICIFFLRPVGRHIWRVYHNGNRLLWGIVFDSNRHVSASCGVVIDLQQEFPCFSLHFVHTICRSHRSSDLVLSYPRGDFVQCLNFCFFLWIMFLWGASYDLLFFWHCSVIRPRFLCLFLCGGYFAISDV